MPRAKHKSSDSTELPLIGDSSVIFKLIRLVNLAAQPFQELIGKKHQLSLNEWRVMVVVHSHPGCSASEVCHFSGLDKMTVSRALARLLKQGRVQRHVDQQDARRQMTSLTATGNTLFKKISLSAAAREKTLSSALTKNQQQSLEQTVDKLTAVLLTETE
jgi:DNA-binding MarR family transcriptional regulator